MVSLQLKVSVKSIDVRVVLSRLAAIGVRNVSLGGVYVRKRYL
jgi:hypothetical protein